jgi:hypothetical protein
MRLTFLSACLLLPLAVGTGTCSEFPVVDDAKRASESQQTALDGRWALYCQTFFDRAGLCHGGSFCAPDDHGFGVNCVRGYRVSGKWNGTLGLKVGSDGSRQIDLTIRPEEGPLEVSLGSYEVRDDVLTVIVGWPGQPRPKPNCKEENKDGWIQYSFKRVKAKRPK